VFMSYNVGEKVAVYVGHPFLWVLISYLEDEDKKTYRAVRQLANG
jgi:hypothetical protein